MSIFIRLVLTIAFVFGTIAMFGCEQQANTPTPSVKPAATTQAADAYPLDVCVVSGEALGGMGDPVIIDHNGREVRFCCASCVDEFKKDPGRYMAKLDAAKGDDHAGHNH
jgi:hemin uptake protein HemP